MKKHFLLTALFLVSITCFSQTKKPTAYNLLLTGASFAVEQNGWFEIGCDLLNAHPINRAVGGENIVHTANKMSEGTLYSPEELEALDALVIMQTHNQNVVDESKLKENYTNYQLPFDNSNYARAYDYVIKKYIADCYSKKDDPKSWYYGKMEGKPAIIILCTDWHDGRTIYNTSIRKLGEKWGLPVVEFDKNIGFSKNQLHPITKKQYNLLYSTDTQTIDGVTFGWHPKRGRQEYIQQRLGSIFADRVKEILPTSSASEGQQTRIIAHRGFWDCEGSAQNSIFALQKTQEIQAYGSEMDVLVTADGVAIINHDDKINNLLIESTPYEQLKDFTLRNGEKIPTLDAYLLQTKKDNQTKLIIEIKPHSTKEKEDQAVKIVTQMVKKHQLEKQVEYISFSLNICDQIVRLIQGAQVAYLKGDATPQEAKSMGLSGLDYHYNVFRTNKNWISDAKQLGLTVNVWTVNDPAIMQEFIDQKVNFITTDKPFELEQLISGRKN